MPPFRIGEWIVDPSDGTLRSAVSVTRVEPRVMALLVLLAEHRGAVVSHDVLFREVWRGTHVAPGALTRAVSVLRTALGDEAKRPRYIETVAKRGYRLISPVDALTGDAQPSAAAGRRTPAARLGLAVAGAALIALTAAAALITWSDAAIATRDPVDTALSRRMTGGMRAYNERAFLGYTRAIAADSASSEALAGLAMTYAFRANYLDRAEWSRLAIATAGRAAALDPAGASAERAQGAAHLLAERYQQAAVHYRHALAKEPADSGTRSNLGLVLMIAGEIARALPFFEQRIAAAPEKVHGYAHLAEALATAGFLEESLQAARAALVVEPYALEPTLILVRADLLAARYGVARVRLERLLEVHPDCVPCVVQLGLIDQLSGRPEEAGARYREARALSPRFVMASLRLAQVALLTGRSADGEPLLHAVEATARAAIADGAQGPAERWHLAAASALGGKRAAALAWYRDAIAAGRRDAAWDRWDPLLQAIRTESAFLAVQERCDTEHAAAATIVRRLAPALAAANRRFEPLMRSPSLIADPPGWPVAK